MADEKTLTNEELFKMYSDWSLLYMHQTLTEDFIREYEDKVDWYNISIYQDLSEDFIRTYQDKVNWYWIGQTQLLSDSFKQEFAGYLS